MEESSSLALDLNYYKGVLYRRRYPALAIGLIVLSVFTWGSFLLPKTYEASATVYIQGTSLVNPIMQGVGVTVSLEERLRNLRNILTSRSLTERVIKKLNLDAHVRNPTQYEGLLEGLKKSLTVTVKSGGATSSDLFFTIAYRGGDPKQVVDLVNTHISESIAINERSRTEDAQGAFTFVERELGEYRAKLDASDKRIRQFREKHPHLVPQSEHTIVGRIEGFETGRIDAEIKLRELVKRRESITKQLSGEKELSVAVVTREGTPQSRLSALNSQLMVLSTKFTDDYPDVIKVKNEIEELKKQIASAQLNKQVLDAIESERSAPNPVYQQLKEDLAKTDTEVDTLRARQREMERQQRESQRVLQKLPVEMEEWTKLQRDRTIFQKIHDDLLLKMESARVSRDLELGQNTTFRVMDPPLEPRLPLSPNRVKMILLGLFFGMASGVGVVLGLDYLNPSFKSEERVRSSLNLPLLASIHEIISQEDQAEIKRLDHKYFRAAAVYLGIIGLVFFEAVFHQLFGIRIINF
ncbi:MAG: XrtA system polysaccharide chain length determinant [Nitrospirota bacterium]